MASNLERIRLAIAKLSRCGSRFPLAAIFTGISLSLQPTALYADGGLRLNLPLRPDMVGRVIGPGKPLVGAESESFMLASFSDGSVTQFSLDGTGETRRFFSPLRKETWRKQRAIALSADGEIFALGAPTVIDKPNTARIYLFDVATGDIRSTIDYLPTRPLSLAFSAYPDGLYLGATFGDGFGPRLWRLTALEEIIESEEIALDQAGFREDCPEDDYRDCNTPALAFNPQVESDFRLVVGGDTGIALYDSQWKRKDAGKLGQLPRVHSIRFNPLNGHRIAVGFASDPNSKCSKHPFVEVYDLLDLAARPLKLEPNPSQISGKDEQPCYLSQVVWSKDGKALYAGGLLWNNVAQTEHASFVPLLGELHPGFDRSLCHTQEGTLNWRCDANAVFRWDLSKASDAAASFPVGTDIVTGLIPYRDTSLIVTTADPFISVYTDRGKLAQSQSSGEILRLTGSGLDLRNRGTLKITDGGLGLRACPFNTPSCFEFNALERRIDKVPFSRDRNSGEECSSLSEILDACIRSDAACPKRKLGIERHEKLQSFVVVPKSDQILLGSSARLRLLDCQDLDDAWHQADSDAAGVRIGSDAFDVAISENQRLVVVAHGDGVFRWYGLSSGQLVLSLFVSPDLDEWLFWTPDGFFDLSGPEVESAVAWVRTTDRGPGQWGIEILPIGDFYANNLKPEQINGVFVPTPQLPAETRGLVPIRETAGKLPSIKIVKPTPGEELRPGRLNLEYVVNNPGGMPDLSWDVSIGGVNFIEKSRAQVVNEASSETRFQSVLTVPDRLKARTSSEVDLRLSFSDPQLMDSGGRNAITLRWQGMPFL